MSYMQKYAGFINSWDANYYVLCGALRRLLGALPSGRIIFFFYPFVFDSYLVFSSTQKVIPLHLLFVSYLIE